ncbi:MAG: hypothetical protein Q8N15_06280, partial [Bacillota bacterium]|nr:hypothetical protein [Bacillota bacterium]
MQDYRTRRAARLNLMKRQTVMKWIAGFTVTIAVAVGSAFSPAAATEAKFLSASSAGTDIVYELYVDASLDLTSDTHIRVVARDQFGDREQSLGPGMSSGIFTDLRADTEYRLLIELDQGFGWRTLDKTSVRTARGPGGAIVGYSLEEAGEYQWETLLRYHVILHVSDPEGAFTSVYFRHAQLNGNELCDTMDFDHCVSQGKLIEPPETRWVSTPVSGTDVELILPDLWGSDYRLFWELRAMTTSGETILLDSRILDTPPSFFAYLGVYDAGLDWIDVSAHVETNPDVPATFEAVVTSPEGETVARFTVDP